MMIQNESSQLRISNPHQVISQEIIQAPITVEAPRRGIFSSSHVSDKEAGASTTMSSTNHQKLNQNNQYGMRGNLLNDIERLVQEQSSARRNAVDSSRGRNLGSNESAQSNGNNNSGTDPVSISINYRSNIGNINSILLIDTCSERGRDEGIEAQDQQGSC